MTRKLEKAHTCPVAMTTGVRSLRPWIPKNGRKSVCVSDLASDQPSVQLFALVCFQAPDELILSPVDVGGD